MRQVLLRPGEDGFWIAEVPSLPGAISQGKTRDEALRNIREAIDLIEQVMRENGDSIPDDQLTASVPNHNTLDRGTLRGIIRLANLTVEEFIALL
jgi:predicted RNase H-like HicB family nuclease